MVSNLASPYGKVVEKLLKDRYNELYLSYEIWMNKPSWELRRHVILDLEKKYGSFSDITMIGDNPYNDVKWWLDNDCDEAILIDREYRYVDSNLKILEKDTYRNKRRRVHTFDEIDI